MCKAELKMSDFFCTHRQKTSGALLYTQDCTNLTWTKEKILITPLEGKMLSTQEGYQGQIYLGNCSLLPAPCEYNLLDCELLKH